MVDEGQEFKELELSKEFMSLEKARPSENRGSTFGVPGAINRSRLLTCQGHIIITGS